MIGKVVEAFQGGDFYEVAALVQQALDEGLAPNAVLNDGLIVGIREVGEQFRRSEVYLPEMMMAADAWQEGMDLLDPLLAGQEAASGVAGKVVVGTVKGDIHSLGKNIVITMFQTAGFKVIDLGVDVPASRFVDEAEKHQADIIALSALMTTTMPQQKDVIEHLYARGQRETYYVMVGGGATNAGWAREINADAYGETAADAIALALAHMEEQKGVGA
jgi:corrinoid protein of di/trimethylamine methyltransferase